jgi:hypothetical protein
VIDSRTFGASPAEVETIMRIVLSKEADLIKVEFDFSLFFMRAAVELVLYS